MGILALYEALKGDDEMDPMIIHDISLQFSSSETSITLFSKDYEILYANRRANENSRKVFGHEISN